MAVLTAEPTRPAHSRRRFTASDVERMLAAGILADGEPVELLDGELVLMSPQRPEHAALTEVLASLLEAACGPGLHVRRHSPLLLAPESLPEPDLAVVEGAPRDFLRRHPAAGEVKLVVEIAFSSQAADRAKAAIYARAGIPVYWLLDLEARCLEIRSAPRPAAGEYAATRRLGADGRAPIPASDQELAVAELLP